MSDNFAELFEASYKKDLFTHGKIVPAMVVRIDKDVVYLDAGTKSEAYVNITQFKDDDGDIPLEIGNTVRMYLEMPVDGLGETRLSREKAIRIETMDRLKKMQEDGEPVTGTVVRVVRGGLSMDIDKIRAFLPRSLIDHRGADLESFLNKPLKVKIVQWDGEKSNLIVSHRMMSEESREEKEAIFQKLNVGDRVNGVVKNITNYGAFVDIGGVDGLLHITDISWKRIPHPSQAIELNQELELQVLNVDREKSRLSLGLKQLEENPWDRLEERFPVGEIVQKRPVSNITNYGIFVNLEDSIEGLVHASELDWATKNPHPNKMFSIEDEVDVKVLGIDREQRRVSLSIKQCIENPWEQFAETYKRGDRLVGPVNSQTDFGLFIGVQGGIDGLVHVSDLSWSGDGAAELKKYRKGDEVEVVILSLDSERGRISLGIKQISRDLFMDFVNDHPKHSVVSGKVVHLGAEGANVELAQDVTAFLRKTEMLEPVELEAEVTASITYIDKKNRQIFVSTKQRKEAEERHDIRQYQKGYKEEKVSNTIGDVIGDAWEGDED